jgi:hypothetical protein
MSSPVPPAPTSVPSRRSRRGLGRYLFIGLAVALLLVALYTWFMLWWSYSEGERAGVLQKFSKRGWICKTYEGELAMYVVGGVAPQIWNFSSRDAAVIDELRAAVGKQVRLHYEEHRGLPTDCFGETAYFVTQVDVVGNPPWEAGAAPPAAAEPSR